MLEIDNLIKNGYESHENAKARYKIENTICPDCGCFLIYRGIINPNVIYPYRTERIFGICDCGYEIEL